MLSAAGVSETCHVSHYAEDPSLRLILRRVFQRINVDPSQKAFFTRTAKFVLLFLFFKLGTFQTVIILVQHGHHFRLFGLRKGRHFKKGAGSQCITQHGGSGRRCFVFLRVPMFPAPGRQYDCVGLRFYISLAMDCHGQHGHSSLSSIFRPPKSDEHPFFLAICSYNCDSALDGYDI